MAHLPDFNFALSPRVGVQVPAGVPLWRAARRAGIRLPSSCLNGTCRTCLCRMSQGQVSYIVEWPGVSADERAEGWVLPCVARALTDVVLRCQPPCGRGWTGLNEPQGRLVGGRLGRRSSGHRSVRGRIQVEQFFFNEVLSMSVRCIGFAQLLAALSPSRSRLTSSNCLRTAELAPSPLDSVRLASACINSISRLKVGGAGFGGLRAFLARVSNCCCWSRLVRRVRSIGWRFRQRELHGAVP